MHCDFLIKAGVDSLYILGTTGEVLLMSSEERKVYAEMVLEFVNGRLPVFVQLGAIPTSAACELARHAEQAGAAGIEAVISYYFHVNQQEIAEYYREIAENVSSDFPVYLYNIQGCTTNDLIPKTVVNLAEVENIVGI